MPAAPKTNHVSDNSAESETAADLANDSTERNHARGSSEHRVDERLHCQGDVHVPVTIMNALTKANGQNRPLNHEDRHEQGPNDSTIAVLSHKGHQETETYKNQHKRLSEQSDHTNENHGCNVDIHVHVLCYVRLRCGNRIAAIADKDAKQYG